MVYLFLADGFEEVEALTPLDLLRRAGKDILTVSISAERAATGAHGITVLADLTGGELSAPCDEMLILPGGMPGTKNLDASPITDRLIDETVENGGHLAAICAAPMILGKRGLLVGKRATCYPGFEAALQGAEVLSVYAVTDGNVTTATGAGAAIPFARELIRVLCGDETAHHVMRSIRQEDVLPRSLDDPFLDEFYEKAVLDAIEYGMTSISRLQRHLSLGYGKARKLLECLYEKGIVGPANERGAHETLVTEDEYYSMCYEEEICE